MFADLKTTNDVKKEEDVLGGISVYESGLYPAKIEMAYATKSAAGAHGLTVHFKIKLNDSNTEYPLRTTFWLTNRQGETYYTDKQGNKRFLAGFSQANTLCLATAGTEIMGVKSETRTIPVWNKDAKSEVPTQVQVPVDMLDGTVVLGLLKIRENQLDYVNGEYVPNEKERFYNNIDRVFYYNNGQPITQLEHEAGVTASDFAIKWNEKHRGKLVDKYKEVAASNSSSTTTPLSIG